MKVFKLELNELFLFWSNITAAATTGPAKGPLPASSTPAIFLYPLFQRDFSISNVGRGSMDCSFGFAIE